MIWCLGEWWVAFWLPAFLAIQLSVPYFFAFGVWCFAASVCSCGGFGVLLASYLLGFGSRFALLMGFVDCCFAVCGLF